MPVPNILDAANTAAHDATLGVGNGIEKVWGYDNIAICVLMVVVLLLFIANGVQFRSNGKRMDKVFERDVLMAKVIAGLEGSVDELKTIFNFILKNFKGL